MEETLSPRAPSQEHPYVWATTRSTGRDKNYNDDHPRQPDRNTRSMVYAELDDLFAREPALPVGRVLASKYSALGATPDMNYKAELRISATAETYRAADNYTGTQRPQFGRSGRRAMSVARLGSPSSVRHLAVTAPTRFPAIKRFCMPTWLGSATLPDRPG